jgi:hypothetical protein
MVEGNRSNEERWLTIGSYRHTVPAVTNAALTRESILDLGPQNRDGRVCDTTLIGKNHWYIEI